MSFLTLLQYIFQENSPDSTLELYSLLLLLLYKDNTSSL